MTRELKIQDMNGLDYFLVEVISHILRYLKDEFLVHHLRRSGQYSITASSLDWVITVPAIWRARGKQLMREAGYKVRNFKMLFVCLLLFCLLVLDILI